MKLVLASLTPDVKFSWVSKMSFLTCYGDACPHFMWGWGQHFSVTTSDSFLYMLFFLALSHSVYNEMFYLLQACISEYKILWGHKMFFVEIMGYHMTGFVIHYYGGSQRWTILLNGSHCESWWLWTANCAICAEIMNEQTNVQY